ncbi:MAG: hypothetical protein B7X04_01560 [Parcubacteria group bacterium 21-54-25]|nr:MAG: hypothetical protein B7X04_01560 [Parcubacteria group bacterium 21-54-25]
MFVFLPFRKTGVEELTGVVVEAASVRCGYADEYRSNTVPTTTTTSSASAIASATSQLLWAGIEFVMDVHQAYHSGKHGQGDRGG